MKKSFVVIGNNYYSWTVLKRIPRSESGPKRTVFLCRCVCGKEKWVDSCNLKKKSTKSCGCAISGSDWTAEENHILEKGYFFESTKKLLSLLPNRTYNGIKIQAAKLDLHRDSQNRSGNASKLLLETPEAYYWAGFIAADGHIDKNKRLQITLAIKDSEHLKKFASFIETQNYREYEKRHPNCSVTIQDPILIGEFAKKFDFDSNKTTIPPRLDWLTGDMFLSFFCGFVDGDGCISKQTGRQDCILRLKGHSSWIYNYSFFEKQIYKESKIEKYRPKLSTHLNKCGYVEIYFSDRKVLRFLKNKAIELKLPILDRKWNKIDLSLPESRYETVKRIKAEITNLKNKGLSQKDIAQKVGISIGYVSMVLNGRR